MQRQRIWRSLITSLASSASTQCCDTTRGKRLASSLEKCWLLTYKLATTSGGADSGASVGKGWWHRRLMCTSYSRQLLALGCKMCLPVPWLFRGLANLIHLVEVSPKLHQMFIRSWFLMVSSPQLRRKYAGLLAVSDAGCKMHKFCKKQITQEGMSVSFQNKRKKTSVLTACHNFTTTPTTTEVQNTFKKRSQGPKN